MSTAKSTSRLDAHEAIHLFPCCCFSILFLLNSFWLIFFLVSVTAIVEKQFELRETEKLVAQLQLGGEILDREWYESIVDSGAFQRFSKTAKDLFAELAKEEGVEV